MRNKIETTHAYSRSSAPHKETDALDNLSLTSLTSGARDKFV